MIVRSQTPPTLPLLVTEPWVSQISQNLTETDSQSEYIKSHISKYLGNFFAKITFTA